MIKIPIVTSDCKIWNKDQLILNIAQNLNHDLIVLDLLAEGPCCKTCGIDDILDMSIDSLALNQDQFVIHTSNQKRSSTYREVRQGFCELEHCKTAWHLMESKKCLSLKTKFGMFIGRSNWKRLGLASHLWHNYYHDVIMSFHFDPALDFFQHNFGLEEYLLENWLDKDIIEFLSALPLKIDQQTYPILYNGRALDLDSQYKDFFCEIVCETYFTGDTFFVTEKTWRPIMNRRPFVVQGPQSYLQNLHRLGFRTFSDWWSEGYDHDFNGGTLESLKNCIDYIANQDNMTIMKWFDEMQPVLDHNIKVLLELTNNQILKTKFNDDE